MHASIRDERGFTLVELLVVILIIGILAAIALPSFLDQQKKAQDASAKSSARQLVTKVEGCYVSEQDYDNCKSSGSNLDAADLPVGSGGGQVDVTATTSSTFTVTAVSKSGNTFSVVKDNTNVMKRTCTGSGGGCKSDNTW